MTEIDLFKAKKEETRNKFFQNNVFLSILENSKNEVSSNYHELFFDNCVFDLSFTIGIDDILDNTFSLIFRNCYFGDISFNNLKSKNVRINFTSCHFEQLFISNISVLTVRILNCIGNINIDNIKSVSINNSIETKSDLKWIDNLPVKKEINEDVYFHLTDIHNLNISNVFFKHSLNKEGILFFNFNISFNKDSNDKLTLIQDCSFLNKIVLIGKPKGELKIKDSRINNIILDKFQPQGTFELFNIVPIENQKEEKMFQIKNSILDNTWFYGIDFNKYELSFFRSSFSNIKFTSVSFPSSNTLINSFENLKKSTKYKDIKENTFYREMYDLFLELKEAFEKRGNIYEAQKMKSVSYHFLDKLQDLHKFNDRLVLKLNKWSNKHGLSPLRAFCLILVFAFGLHFLNILSFKSISLGFNNWSVFYEIFSSNLKYLTIIANPIHKVSDLAPTEEISDMTYFVSFLSRIIIGYLYYQFISAFRRFGKI